MATKIILDVDTGTDDAVALMTAALSPDIELVGATVVNGNTVLDSCVENTLRVFEWIGMPEVPVFRGMSRPIARSQGAHNPATRIHGDKLDLPEATITAQPQHAVDWLIDTYLASDGDITLVPVGPLTNIAMAIQKEPRILERIPEIVIMGGAHDHGNSTASAEFNIWLDPEAARIVVGCGRPIRMVPLELLRLDRVVPVVAGVQQVHPLRQHQDVVVADIGRPRLEQAHRDVGILRQPRGQRAAGGAAAGDHIVECAGVR